MSQNPNNSTATVSLPSRSVMKNNTIITNNNNSPKRRKISTATVRLFGLIFTCSLLLVVDQIRRLGSLGNGNGVSLNDSEATTHGIPEQRFKQQSKRQQRQPQQLKKYVKLPWSLPNEGAEPRSSRQFMINYRQKQQQQLQQQRRLDTPLQQPRIHHSNNGTTTTTTPLPTPIFVLNLPKSGTETSRDYFACGGYQSSHTYVGRTRIGTCLLDNFKLSSNATTTSRPLRGCDEITKKYYLPKTDPRYGTNVTVQVYSDVGTPSPTCFYPTLHDGGLEYLYRYYPDATWVLFVRDGGDWYESMMRWYNGTLLRQWENACGFSPSGIAGEEEEEKEKQDWVDFYQRHTEKIRRFVLNHPTLTYIEVELEGAKNVIGEYTGIDDKCWRHCLPGKDDDDKCVEIGETRNETKKKKKKNESVTSQKILERKVTKGIFQNKTVIMDNSPPLPWSLPKVPSIRKNATEFMKELSELKRELQISLPWEGNHSSSIPKTNKKKRLKLPTPIFILNLPKSGTQTLTEYFKCGNIESSHTYVYLTRTGDCLRDNYLADASSNATGGVDPLRGCNEISKKYHIAFSDPNFGKNVTVQTYSDIGTPYPGRCFYSSVNDGGLEHIYKYYPNATIMLLTREVDSWYSSMTKWNKGQLLKAWKHRCGFHGSIGDGSKDDWIDFYHSHTEKIRNFAREHPTMTYVEMELEDAPSMIDYYTGVDSECFQHCLPGKKHHEMCKPIGGYNASVSSNVSDADSYDYNDRNNGPSVSKTAVTREKVIVDNSPPLPWSLPKVPANRKTSKEFMKELNALKREQRILLPWEASSQDSNLKLPTPIFILNLPKSGTQTLTEYFKCGKVESSHTYVRLTRTGDCLRDNYLADASSNSTSGVDPLRGCNEITKIYHTPKDHPDHGKNVTVETFSDIGTPHPGRCFYSSVNDGGLEHIYKHYPNATIMLLTREVDSWYSSMTKWNSGSLLKKWKSRCGFHGSIGDGSKDDWIDFYHAHTEKIRNFAREHLTMTYVEIELEDAPSMIDYYTGVDVECFQHCLPGKKTGEACKPLPLQVSLRK
ncbi:hypothetical protein ACHAW6_011387 [Cyclotella cf. meneghiniana]